MRRGIDVIKRRGEDKSVFLLGHRGLRMRTTAEKGCPRRRRKWVLAKMDGLLEEMGFGV